jgi:hypothetical protein
MIATLIVRGALISTKFDMLTPAQPTVKEADPGVIPSIDESVSRVRIGRGRVVGAAPEHRPVDKLPRVSRDRTVLTHHPAQPWSTIRVKP